MARAKRAGGRNPADDHSKRGGGGGELIRSGTVIMELNPADDQQKRGGGGGKLARSEVVTVRLDPRLRYLAELAARKQRRTLSSFIEWAVEQALNQVILRDGTSDEDGTTVSGDARWLWDVDEAERFVRLAVAYPLLLTFEEQQLWKLLNDSSLLNPAKTRTPHETTAWKWNVMEETVLPVVRAYWEHLIQAFQTGPAEQREWLERTVSDVASGKVYPPVDDAGKKRRSNENAARVRAKTHA